MFGTGEAVGTVGLDTAHTGLDAALTAFADVELTAASSSDLTESLRQFELLAARLGTLQRHLVAEVDQRNVAGEFCAASTANLLRDLLRITGTEAGVRVAQARDYGPRRALGGETLAPVLPLIAAAVDSGTMSLAHAKIITKVITELPAEVEREFGVQAQTLLIKQSAALNPTQLAHVATRLRDTLNPDGKYTTEHDHQRRRDFTLIINPDGSAKPTGHWTPELTTAFRPVLDSLSQPCNTPDLKDDRSAGQRRHDALLDMTMRLLRTATLPDTGGCPTTITLTMTETQAAAHAAAHDGHAASHDRDGDSHDGGDGDGGDRGYSDGGDGDGGDGDGGDGDGGDGGLVEDGYGTLLTMATAMRLATLATIIPVVLNASGGIMNLGRTRRLATPAQRRALAARDKGCSFPGCTRHAAFTEVHHIIEWLKGGHTNLTNLVLVCSYHHRHFETAGWQVRMNPDDQLPDWIPPTWTDPNRRPQRNTAHHLPLLV